MPEIIIGPRRSSPFDVELTVFEEDTWLVLSAGNFARETRHPTEELVDDMASFSPHALGELIVKGNRACAIVHDLDRTPSCDDESVCHALDALFAHCQAAGLRAIAIQPLGCVYAPGRITDFIDRLRAHPRADDLDRIWVVT